MVQVREAAISTVQSRDVAPTTPTRLKNAPRSQRLCLMMRRAVQTTVRAIEGRAEPFLSPLAQSETERTLIDGEQEISQKAQFNCLYHINFNQGLTTMAKTPKQTGSSEIP